MLLQKELFRLIKSEWPLEEEQERVNFDQKRGVLAMRAPLQQSMSLQETQAVRSPAGRSGCQVNKKLQGNFFTGTPPKVPSTEKLILARLGVSRTIYVNVDSPNLGFSYFNFLGEAQCKITPCISWLVFSEDEISVLWWLLEIITIYCVSSPLPLQLTDFYLSSSHQFFSAKPKLSLHISQHLLLCPEYILGTWLNPASKK